jgi:hypothetical protein
LLTFKLLVKLKCEFEGENIKRRSGHMLLSSQHIEGRKTRWSFGMGTRTNDKRSNCSHRPAQTK